MDYCLYATATELKRWLKKQGAIFTKASGDSHLHVFLNGRRSAIPMHGKNQELKTKTYFAILKQLGLKE